MPTLNWIGKEAVINHDKDVPFRLLKPVKKLSVGENSQNLIIEGDNLEALKALMPYYYGKIKCIYIDPPYNTGNEKWVYNDKVNSPKIKKWLGQVVGGEAEDLCRHDKWLCMMYPRLKLLRELLRDDGAIFISIDDNELYNLKEIMNDIFAEDNFICNFIWKKRSGGGYSNTIVSNNHDYIMVFAKNKSMVNFNDRAKDDLELKRRYPLEDNKGIYKRRDLRKSGTADLRKDRPTMYYPVVAPDGTKIVPKTAEGNDGRWSVGEKKYGELAKDGEIEFVKNRGGWKAYIKERPYNLGGEMKDEKWETILSEIALNSHGKNELKQIFPEREVLFDHPKPKELIKFICKIATNETDYVLDSFAGCGTTGHAVIDLNKTDSGKRKFILIEIEEDIARNTTSGRLRRVIDGVGLIGPYHETFHYCALDKPLFDKDGQIDSDCSFEQLGRYIFFTETKTNLDVRNVSGSFLSEANGTDYYLIFKGIGKNVLNNAFLKKLKKNDNLKVVYADKCLVDEEILMKNKVVFKQIPYEVKIF